MAVIVGCYVNAHQVLTSPRKDRDYYNLRNESRPPVLQCNQTRGDRYRWHFLTWRVLSESGGYRMASLYQITGSTSNYSISESAKGSLQLMPEWWSLRGTSNPLVELRKWARLFFNWDNASILIRNYGEGSNWLSKYWYLRLNTPGLSLIKILSLRFLQTLRITKKFDANNHEVVIDRSDIEEGMQLHCWLRHAVEPCLTDGRLVDRPKRPFANFAT